VLSQRPTSSSAPGSSRSSGYASSARETKISTLPEAIIGSKDLTRFFPFVPGQLTFSPRHRGARLKSSKLLKHLLAPTRSGRIVGSSSKLTEIFELIFGLLWGGHCPYVAIPAVVHACTGAVLQAEGTKRSNNPSEPEPQRKATQR